MAKRYNFLDRSKKEKEAR